MPLETGKIVEEEEEETNNEFSLKPQGRVGAFECLVQKLFLGPMLKLQTPTEKPHAPEMSVEASSSVHRSGGLGPAMRQLGPSEMPRVPSDGPPAELPKASSPSSSSRSMPCAAEETQEHGLKLDGWLLVERAALACSIALAHSSFGMAMEPLFWKWRYFELGAGRLSYWTSKERRHASKAPQRAFLLAMLDEVHVRGHELMLHFNGVHHSLRLRAPTGSEAERWGYAVRSAVTAHLQSELPPSWDLHAMLSPRKGSPRLVAKEFLSEDLVGLVQHLVDHCFICKRTKDRKGLDLPLRLEVVDVIQVQNGAAWKSYSKARSKICDREAAAEQLNPALLTATLDDPMLQRVLGNVGGNANEQWLFHGTTAAAVEGISDKEFRLDLAGCHRGTMYGKGVYLAECSSKADEYAEADESGLCRILLCRAALGRILVNREKSPSKDLPQQCRLGGYDSLCGDRWAAVGTFREFVLYENSQVYPAFILQYRRVMEADLCRKIRDVDQGANNTAAHLFPYVARLAGEHPDSTVKYRLFLLLATHAETSVPILADALTNKQSLLRRTAATALMRLAEHTASVECMSDGTLRRHHREGAPAIASAVPALTLALADDDATLRKTAAKTLEYLDRHAAPAVPALIACLSDSSEDVRKTAVTALGRLGASASPAVLALAGCLSDTCKAVCIAAAVALGQLGVNVSSAVPQLLVCLNDQDHDIRAAAVSAFGQLGTYASSAVPSIIELLTDTQEAVRRTAAAALGCLGSTAASSVPALTRALKDADAGVRKAAATSLGQMGVLAAASVSALADSLRDSTEQVRRASAVSLGRMGSQATAAVPALVKRGLIDSSAEVRAASATTLVDLVRLDQLGIYADLVEEAMHIRLKDSNIKVRKAATMCLAHFRIEADEEEDGDDVTAVTWRRTEEQMRQITAVYSKIPRSQRP